MGTILEQAGSVAEASSPTSALANPGGGSLRLRVVDEGLTTDLVLTFPDATRATVAALRAYYAEHRTGTFDYTVPDAGLGSAPTIAAEFVDPPTYQFAHARRAHVTVRIRRALLTD